MTLPKKLVHHKGRSNPEPDVKGDIVENKQFSNKAYYLLNN